jgi:hypothetical protein
MRALTRAELVKDKPNKPSTHLEILEAAYNLKIRIETDKTKVSSFNSRMNCNKQMRCINRLRRLINASKVQMKRQETHITIQVII